MIEQAVILGRFQPLHVGHERLIKTALSKAKVVYVILCSGGEKECNPFSFEQRAEMIMSTFSKDAKRIFLQQVWDTPDNEDWIADVYSQVPANPTILVGCPKDASTEEYLKWFPKWIFTSVREEAAVSGTTVRFILSVLTDYVNPKVLEIITRV